MNSLFVSLYTTWSTSRWLNQLIDLFVVLFSFMFRHVYTLEYNLIKNFETSEMFAVLSFIKKKKKKERCQSSACYGCDIFFSPPAQLQM